MYKLRQTWNEVFPVRTLYDIDVRVQKIDPAWPITANLSGGKSSSTNVSKNVPTKPPPPPSTQVNVVNVVNNMTHTSAVASSLSMKSISSSTSVNIQEVKYCFNFHYFSFLSLSLSISSISFIINTSKSNYFSEYCM